MAGYVDYTVAVDPAKIVAGALAELAAWIGVDPAALNEGDPVVAAVEVAALRTAETRVVMADIARAAFRDSGLKIDGVAHVAAEHATMESAWAMVDAAGYTIPAGTRVAHRISGDWLVAFDTAAEFTVAPGATVAAGVEVRALVAGAAANGLGPGALVLVDPLTAVASVVSTTSSAGGVDAESDLAYVDRLAAFRRRRSDRLILPADFESATEEHPSVARALAVANYDPAAPLVDSERHVTVAVVGAGGDALPNGDQAEVLAILEARREVNFVGHVIDPTYTAVAVAFTATALAGYDPAAVQAAAIAAVEAWLSPARWGGGSESPAAWRDETVTVYEVGAVIDRVAGVDQVLTVSLDGGAAAITLAGVAPLPAATGHPTTPSTISGTVT